MWEAAMSDDGSTWSPKTLEELAAQFQAETEALRSEVRRLYARLNDETAARPPRDAPEPANLSSAAVPASDEWGSQLDHPVSRRAAFKVLGAAAAGGVGLGIGSALLGADPAAAANPDFILDQANTGNGTTALTGAIVDPLLMLTASGVDNPSPGAALYAVGNQPSKITEPYGGDYAAGFGNLISDTDLQVPAVVGLNSGGAEGVFGVSGGIPNIDVPASAGVVGTGMGNGLGGVIGVSSDGDGVFGASGSRSAVETGLTAGVLGDSRAGVGVIGSSGKNGVAGVLGVSGKQSGIAAVSRTGVLGDTNGDGVPGVTGTSSGGDGVHGVTTAGATSGVAGLDQSPGDAAHGVFGESTNGIGGAFIGGRAPLYLAPSGTAGPPSSSTAAHSLGEIYVDQNGAVFVCTASGSPGTWRQVALSAPSYDNEYLSGTLGTAGSVNLLEAPIRLFDSQDTGTSSPADPGRPAGALKSDSITTLTIGGATVGSASILAGAVGVIGTATAVHPTATGNLCLFRAGDAKPNVVSLEFTKGVSSSSLCVVGLNPLGQIKLYASAATDAYFDAVGFVF
jgi:hypothetical protein